MADHTPIEWADATCNAVNGCSVLSPGCKHCYAMKQAHRVAFRRGLVSRTAGGQVWNGDVYLHEKSLLQPLRWRRPRRIFWNAHGDLFHENVPDAWIDRVFAVCALTPQHTHMILTKRPERMREYCSDDRTQGRIARVIIDMLLDKVIAWREPWPVRSIGDIDDPTDLVLTSWPLPNVWLGTSVEDQTRADERIPHLLATPAARRFVSLEPLLGPVDLDCPNLDWSQYPAGHGINPQPPEGDGRLLIDWVIVGGESGPGARPMHPDWARSLRDLCAAAGIPFFFKQWGAWLPWEPEHGPCWKAQNGQLEDHHMLFPDDMDNDPNWDDGLWAFPEWHHFAFQRIGKKAAGRLLDGREHSDFPGTLARGVGGAGEPA